MKNFPIIDSKTGREYWISRSVAIVAFIYSYDEDDNEYILAEQRGEGTPDPEFIGCWCLPCGYLDYDESAEEAAAREIFEETGVKISPEHLDFLDINTDPKADKRQNVTLRFEGFVDNLPKLTTVNSEYNEVSDVKWIPISEIDNYKWAFNHLNLIKNYQ